VACLSMSDPIVGISGSFAFIVVGFYGALFHCAKATTYNVTVTATVGVILLWRAISRGEDAVLVGCEFAVLIGLSIGSPYMINTMMRLIASDIARLDFDALTGLLNRRGFYRRTGRLIDQHAGSNDCHLTIAMIDLDHFKRLNDDHGHAAGDRALIDVGHALQGSAGTAAVVARAGGEEFLVADASPAGLLPFAPRLCDAVANTPHGITASVGSVATAIAGLADDDRTSVIDQLIAHADTAMYIAKAAGGNQHHSHPDGAL
jgi:diguanylate cyclase (GGDEF)-like protein